MKKWLAVVVLLCLCVTSLAESFQKGDSGDGVRQLQERLAELGYMDADDVDGRYGSRTESAVTRYQARHDMEQTGQADEATLDAIMGTTVRAAQEKLIELGYLDGAADGVFGGTTEIAVRRFQLDHGLRVTGELDEATLEALESAQPGDAAVIAQAQEEEYAEVDDRPEEEQIREAQENLILLGYLSGKADGIAGKKTKAAIQAFQSEYGLQATGELDAATKSALNRQASSLREISRLQARLIELGYLTGSADGVYGDKTKTALRWFQRVHGLKVSGSPDEETMEALFSDEATALRPALKQGDEGDAVEQLQNRLIAMGFLSGKADGKYGQYTAAAVESFQKHLIKQGIEMTANGDATPITQELLFSEAYSTYLNDVEPGVQDSEAERVERRLIYLGYMDEAADDVLDDYAVEALDAFREAADVSERGAAGEETFRALFSEDAPVAETYLPHAISRGSSGKAVYAFQQALQCYGFTTSLPSGLFDEEMSQAIASLYSYLKGIRYDDAELYADAKELSVEAQRLLTAGALKPYQEDVKKDADATEVRRVQTRLYSLYYLELSGVDGKFGDGARSAVKEFQEQNGLEVTGVADKDTQDLLFSEDAVENKRPWLIEIDIDAQRLYVSRLQEDGSYERVRTCICSTGLNDATPRGIFLNGRPVNKWHYFKDYYCWAQYSYLVEGHIMIHSVLYSSNDESTLRKGSVYSLGKKASHGCIRLSVEDALYVFENCKSGQTIIKIY